MQKVKTLTTTYFAVLGGGSINDVTQFRTIFNPPPPIVTRFITKALVLLSKNHWPLPPLDRDVIYGRPLS